jgi:hypothetical protein
MIVRFSHYHRQPAVCHRNFFEAKGLRFIVIQVIGTPVLDEVILLRCFLMGLVKDLYI